MKSIFGFLGLLLAAFLWIMPSAVAEVTCPAKPAGPVSITWSSDEIEYDLSKSQAQMDRMENDTQSPYKSGTKTHVGGLMNGGVSIRSQVQVATLTYPRTREMCQWIEQVNVDVVIDPKIYIARENKRGSCKYNAILDHEMKHIYVDREIVRQYVPTIKKTLEKAVLDVGIVGPKSAGDQEKYHRKINDYIEGEIKKINDRINAERRKRQQQVDSLAEYERVSKLCP